MCFYIYLYLGHLVESVCCTVCGDHGALRLHSASGSVSWSGRCRPRERWAAAGAAVLGPPTGPFAQTDLSSPVDFWGVLFSHLGSTKAVITHAIFLYLVPKDTVNNRCLVR